MIFYLLTGPMRIHHKGKCVCACVFCVLLLIDFFLLQLINCPPTFRHHRFHQVSIGDLILCVLIVFSTEYICLCVFDLLIVFFFCLQLIYCAALHWTSADCKGRYLSHYFLYTNCLFFFHVRSRRNTIGKKMCVLVIMFY